MQPRPPQPTPGSFINREKLEHTVAAARKQAQEKEDEILGVSPEESPIVHVPPSEDVKEALTAGAPDEKKKAEKAKQAEEITAVKLNCEEALQITITEEDATACIFKGRLTKEVTLLKTGEQTVKCVFRTLTPKELKEVDQKVAKFQKENEDGFTAQGLRDEQGMTLLSYGWIACGGRPLGTTSEERRATMDNMSAHLIGYATTAWNNFDILVQISLNNGKFVKKS